MKKTNKNESGFGAVEVIIVLVIVGLLGAIGWFVWAGNNNKTIETPDVSHEAGLGINSPPISYLTEFKDADLGIKFSYPKKWGAATIKKGNPGEVASGNYSQVTFSKQSLVDINFVIGPYSSPLDGCVAPVKEQQHELNKMRSSVIGWDSNNIKQYWTGQGFNGPTVYLVNIKPGDTGPGWKEIGNPDKKVLVYEDFNKNLYKATTADQGCNTITAAEADEANAYAKYIHFAVNYSNSMVKGVNAQYDARNGAVPEMNWLIDTLNTLN